MSDIDKTVDNDKEPESFTITIPNTVIDPNTIESMGSIKATDTSNNEPNGNPEKEPETEPESSVDPGLVVPYLPELTGIWAIEPRASKAMYRVLERFIASGFDVNSIHPGVIAKADRFEEQSLTERYVSMYNEGVAVIDIKGTLMKEEPPSRWLNASAITYPQLTELLAELVEDNTINRIVLKFASNGGTLEGAFQCADSIYDFGKQKPIIAYCDDKCNSAAYLLASQCKQIIAGEGSVIGSIGIMVALTDESEKDKMLGYKRFVVASTKLKGLGADKKVTKELLAEVQKHVDDYYDLFKDRVMRGRNMTEEEMEAAATGSIFLPEEALELKLIDKVTNFYKMFDVTAESDKDEDPVIPEEGGFESMAMTAEEQATYDAAIKEANELKAQIGNDEEAKKKAAEAAAQAEAKEKAELQAKLDAEQKEKDELAKKVAEMEAKQEADAQAQAEREMKHRKDACLSWIQQHMEAGAIIPANVPKLKSFLGIILPLNKVIETEYQAADGTTKKFEGQLYEFALEVLGDGAAKKIDFGEQASSRSASESVAGSETAWLERELEKDGVTLDDDQPLAKVNKQAALPEKSQSFGLLTDGWN